jgi:hypothetical protein
MKIIDMRPEITPWKQHTHKTIGKWSYADSHQSIGGHIRKIWHYDTLMAEFVGFEREFDKARGEMVMEWTITPKSLGHGSVSDQGGMNQLMSITYLHGHGITTDYGYYYSRDAAGGGARVEMTGTEHTSRIVVL